MKRSFCAKSLLFLTVFTGAALQASRPVAEAEDLVRQAYQDFSVRLLKELGTKDNIEGKNLLLSPVSLSVALSMALMGMTGDSADETEKALSFSKLSKREIMIGSQAFLHNLVLANKTSNKVLVSNGLWVAEGYTAQKAFGDLLTSVFHAYASSVDFAGGGALKKINETVSVQTGGMISPLLKSTSPNDLMHITSAVYLAGAWKRPFNKKETFEAKFKGVKEPVPMMTRMDKEIAVDEDDYQAVRLPLGDGSLVVDLVLPYEDIDVFLNSLSVDTLNHLHEVLSKAEPTKAYLKLPRLNLSFQQDFVPTLQALEMRTPFKSEAGPDLAGMFFFNDKPVKDLQITDVVHAAKLEVDEKGVKGGASTDVVGGLRSLPPTYAFNRPFLILLKDTEGTSYFTGVVGNPAGL